MEGSDRETKFIVAVDDLGPALDEYVVGGGDTGGRVAGGVGSFLADLTKLLQHFLLLI